MAYSLKRSKPNLKSYNRKSVNKAIDNNRTKYRSYKYEVYKNGRKRTYKGIERTNYSLRDYYR